MGLRAYTNNQIDADTVIFNFSDKVLNNEKKEILKYGLEFSLPSTKPKFIDFLSF